MVLLRGGWLVCRFLLRRSFFRRREGRLERDEAGGGLEGRLQVLEGGKLLERSQVEIVEESPGGGEDRRAPGRFAVADDLDPAAFDQRVQRGRRHRDAAHFLDVAARDRLAVRDDGEGLQHRARIARRLLDRKSTRLN